MLLKHLSLTNFRNYTKSEFTFSKGTTLIVGPNTSGKTNILEAIFFLSTGKSFRAERDSEMVKFNQNVARIKGITNEVTLEVVIAENLKKYLVNNVGKRQIDFAGNLYCVLFSPVDLDIVVDSPSLRREFLDRAIVQVDRDYRIALVEYSKGLRHRNALLEKTRETGVRNRHEFEYWDRVLIDNGEIITKNREDFIDFINQSPKDVFDFTVFYDKSLISEARLAQYKKAEVGAGVTLVGPHRDDIKFKIQDSKFKINRDLKSHGSRGEQRLTVLQLKLLELEFIQNKTGERLILLLDDIFSELDNKHINHVIGLIDNQQTIITTTHKEFIPRSLLGKMGVIELPLK